MFAKIPSPSPIFDNLDHLENPFHCHSFNISTYFDGLHASIYHPDVVSKAHTDFEYSWKFLYSYNGSTATFNTYRTDVERFLLWAWLVKGLAVVELKREDIEQFIKFCQKPPLAWVGVKTVSRFIDKDGERVSNPVWRPFLTRIAKTARKDGQEPDAKNFTLSQAAVKSIFAILSSFYNFLMQEELLESNPVLLIRQKSKYIQKQQFKAPVRRVSNLQWDFVMETVEQMAADNPAQHERSLFIMSSLYAMYLRISELVADERSTPAMSDFRKDIDGNWWFHVTGKGNKSRIVSVSDAMLSALKRYRSTRSLSPLPTPGEHSPLIPKSRGNGPVTSTRQIRNIVQQCFDATYERMLETGLANDATELRVATVHWLRHTGISEDVKHRPREHVRDDAGHASMQTTDRYIESDLRERHASAKKKMVKDNN